MVVKMGMHSPTDGKYYAIVRTITRDGKPAHKADDVIAFELENGEVVGGEEYEAYDKLRKEVLTRAALEKQNVDKTTNAKLAQAYKTLILTPKEAK